MKNISLHAPLNNTNRNWERALIKKAKSGGSSLEKGTFAYTLYSIPEEQIAQLPNPPELITVDAEYSLYYLEIEGTPNSSSGLVVLHDYNDLTLSIVIRDTAESTVKLATVFTDINDIGTVSVLEGVTFTQGGYHWRIDEGDVSPFIFIQDDILNETLYNAIGAFLDHEFPPQPQVS